MSPSSSVLEGDHLLSMKRKSSLFWIKEGRNIRKMYKIPYWIKGAFSLSRLKKSNLSIGEAAGIPLSFSYLFCRHLLASSYFDGSVIQKVQETIGRVSAPFLL